MAGLNLDWLARLEWEARRGAGKLMRLTGWPGLAAIALFGCVVAGLLVSQRLAARLDAAEDRLSQVVQSEAARPSEPIRADEGLEKFQAYLPAHDDIPDILKRLLLLAEDHDLMFASGEYKAEPEDGYMSYRMALPVKGDAAAIQSFLLAALKQHPTLALESATFHRERVDAREVDARLNFVLLARLPSGTLPAANRENHP